MENNKDKKTLSELKTTTLLSYRGKAVEKMDDKKKLAQRLKGITRSGQIVKSRMQKKVEEQVDNPEIYADVNKRPTPISPSGAVKSEQHREEGRFKPVKPHNVKNVAVASPRPTSDSANVKLKEESLDEISMEKLTQYKTAAAKSASEADKAGDIAKGNKRFSGIIKATKKQFGKTMKEESDIQEGMELSLDEKKKKTENLPFDPPYQKAKPDTVTDKSGAKHTAFSRAKHLARMAARKAGGVKEEAEIVEAWNQPDYSQSIKARQAEADKKSRKAAIVRAAHDKAKQKKKTVKEAGPKDKFEANPELSSQIIRNN